ncbi:MAG TPA: alpha/beta hydrolase [Christensenellaceae bacterium]|nr:alpha/beta hydrolase [Christensenellaceae bacterium]
MHEIKLNLNGQAEDCILSLYLISNSYEVAPSRKRPVVIICPGGGFNFLSFREAEPVAIKMLSYGYHAAVLYYSTEPAKFPTQLLQAMAAVNELRSNADEYNIDPDRICIMGFSAGGHVAASLGVFWNKPYYSGLLGIDPEAIMPNALCLGYPVITSGDYAHEGSIENLEGENNRLSLSLEKQVSDETPPCFIFHTLYDDIVPIENSILFAKALKIHGVPFELHVFEEGPHGISLGNTEVYDYNSPNLGLPFAAWADLFNSWFCRK